MRERGTAGIDIPSNINSIINLNDIKSNISTQSRVVGKLGQADFIPLYLLIIILMIL